MLKNYSLMPMIELKAVKNDEIQTEGVYTCPVYATSKRGEAVFVAQFPMETRE